MAGWFPISLDWTRILLALLVTGCINSGSAPSLQDLRDRHTEAVESVKTKGGTVEEKQYPPGTGYAVSLKGATIDDEDIESLRSISGLAELDLSGSTITDEQLAKLVEEDPTSGRPVAVLFCVNLSDTSVTDVGLRELSVLKLLSDVNVKGSQVTDAGVKEFQLLCGNHQRPFGLKFKIEK